MSVKVSDVRDELADREAIRDTIIQYARSVDRLDMTIGSEIFWPGATDEHAGVFNGSVSEFYKMVEPVLREMRQTQHILSNMTIRINDSDARTETYVVAYHEMEQEGLPYLLIGGGRLLDTLTKREDEWRITKRKLVIDWMKGFVEAQVGVDLKGHVIAGSRAPHDLSYPHFAY